jgi:NADH-quinone oxidoreductase subunit J
MKDVLFLVASAVCVLSALSVVTRRNPIYSAISLIAFFGGMALLFLLLRAPFVAGMQLIVYAGAILVLFLFVIMLLSLREEELGTEKGGRFKAAAAALAAALACLVIVPVLASEGSRDLFAPIPGDCRACATPFVAARAGGTGADAGKVVCKACGAPARDEDPGAAAAAWERDALPGEFGSTEYVGTGLFGRYALAFEVTGVLILAAMLGAVAIAKKKL